MARHFVIIFLFIFSFQVQTAEYGPFRAEIIRVIDGDSVEIRAFIWPGLTKQIHLRLKGIDAPEIRSRCKSETAKKREKQLAHEARDFVQDFLVRAKIIEIGQISLGKYAGRVVGKIYGDGMDLSRILLEVGLAKKYDGGKRDGWCK